MNASDLKFKVNVINESDEVLFMKHASIIPTNGFQYVSGHALNNEISHVITVRYDPRINKTHRIMLGSRLFGLNSPPINKNEANMWTIMNCIEVV